ncbi:beta-hydroxyacyl-(acyl-carrier-protein) dehydratase FabZ [Salmonella enterica subsp. enterica]|nr:beta-hydroxyacyl-(acyl-carrier-protein) dehydratase FabZ [Salmonella enterica subsp. enterica]
MTTNTHTLQIEEILELLPHRFPFLLVDRVLDFEEGRFLRAVKMSPSTSRFPGAFPGQTDFARRADSGSDGAGNRYSGV